ncbi:hypothetical protein B0H16DRAFT_1824723 [Mycena metata]|uniref:Uncharacterized protein n=1 Tax=Mycena metata TaxID=1033252 RepID=A0AAD7J4N0_9AGAR|nr:hypothetical protein B0H16DRAFT_1824723 [Mycena metata]
MAMYRWLVYLAFFPAVSLAAFIVDNLHIGSNSTERFHGGGGDLAIINHSTRFRGVHVSGPKHSSAAAVQLIIICDFGFQIDRVRFNYNLFRCKNHVSCILHAHRIKCCIECCIIESPVHCESTNYEHFCIQPPNPITFPSPARTSTLTTASTSLSIATGSGGFTQPGVGAYSTMLPAQGLSIQKSSPVGLILGLLIPGILLLAFFCVFLVRRRKRSAPAGIEELAVKDGQDTPTWYMKTDQPNPWTAYGTPSSRSYRTSYQESEFSSSTRSGSISRVSPFQLPSSRPDSDASSIRFLSLVPPPNTGASAFTAAAVEPLPPPPAP